jgi:hypothetical protein
LAALLLDFDYYPRPEKLPVMPPHDMYDKIEFAITCNENISDTELSQYILAS